MFRLGRRSKAKRPLGPWLMWPRKGKSRTKRLIGRFCYGITTGLIMSKCVFIHQKRINSGENWRKQSQLLPVFSPSSLFPPPELRFDTELVYWEITSLPPHSAVCHIHLTLPDCRRGNNRKHFPSRTQTVSMETKFFDLLFIIHELVPALGRASLFDGTKQDETENFGRFPGWNLQLGRAAATRRH